MFVVGRCRPIPGSFANACNYLSRRNFGVCGRIRTGIGTLGRESKALSVGTQNLRKPRIPVQTKSWVLLKG